VAKSGGHVLRHLVSSLSSVVRQICRQAGKQKGKQMKISVYFFKFDIWQLVTI